MSTLSNITSQIRFFLGRLSSREKPFEDYFLVAISVFISHIFVYYIIYIQDNTSNIAMKLKIDVIQLVMEG